MVVSNLYSLKPGLLGPPGVVGDILGAIIIQDTGRPGGTNARLPNRSALPRVRARGQKDAEKGGERRFRSAAGANHGVVKRSIFLAGGRHTRTIYRFARGLGHSRSRNAMKNMSGAWPNGPARRRKIEPSFIYALPPLCLALSRFQCVCSNTTSYEHLLDRRNLFSRFDYLDTDDCPTRNLFPSFSIKVF